MGKTAFPVFADLPGPGIEQGRPYLFRISRRYKGEQLAQQLPFGRQHRRLLQPQLCRHHGAYAAPHIIEVRMRGIDRDVMFDRFNRYSFHINSRR